MTRNPQTILGERFDWEPVEFGVRIPKAADMPAERYELGVATALQMMIRHARQNQIAIDTIRRHETPGSILLYFDGVRVLEEERARRLRAALRPERAS